ncbi:extensin family protein [Mesorhizobium sp. BH1-1-4]|uniref:extensin-like domain-containing protein n=1 Tax=Mesorhizobium sp. BH1-1-4 TaxID=2876662 RepID=UPI001CD0F3D5|nr:extensin family protein [Mesorhizobium sp. BH1-1-4]MBZ9997370.1 extensin family protein [Mesorhizobium sp. BH1-1-4]
MDQPLTQRADQPLRPRSKRQSRARVRQHIAPNSAPQKTPDAQPSADVPVPEPRPADAPKVDAPKTQDRNTEGPKSGGTSDLLKDEESHQKSPTPPEPPAETESEPEPSAVVPTPTPKPDTTTPEPQPRTVAPQPTPKPAEADDEEKMLPDPRSADLPADKMPAEEVACRERLKTLGVEFEEHKAESNPEIGCSIPYPIMLKTLGKSIAITPGTELNCPMAEAAVRFAADVIQPAAKAEFGADLKSISQASAFVCRPRHGTRKLSEHAFGNALDIASFTLSDGKTIEVGPAPPEKDGKFLDAVRKAACGPFKTVLGPGADADHSLHFHFDLEPRRHGGTFCQ